jgi:hypothetical protein
VGVEGPENFRVHARNRLEQLALRGRGGLVGIAADERTREREQRDGEKKSVFHREIPWFTSAGPRAGAEQGAC